MSDKAWKTKSLKILNVTTQDGNLEVFDHSDSKKALSKHWNAVVLSAGEESRDGGEAACIQLKRIYSGLHYMEDKLLKKLN